MVADRLGRRLPLLRLSRETIGVGLMALVMLATVPFSVWPGGALGHLHRHLLQGRAGVPADGQQRQERQDAALADLVDPRAPWATWRRAVFSTIAAVSTSSKANGSTDRSPGLMGNPNDLAMNMVTFLPLAVVIAIQRGRAAAARVAATSSPC